LKHKMISVQRLFSKVTHTHTNFYHTKAYMLLPEGLYYFMTFNVGNWYILDECCSLIVFSHF
jgi:hypothetical protein